MVSVVYDLPTDLPASSRLFRCVRACRLWAEGGLLTALNRFITPAPTPEEQSDDDDDDSGDDSGDKSKATDGVAASACPARFEEAVLYLVFSSNFVGVLCARSLHYQFYAWCAALPPRCPAKAA